MVTPVVMAMFFGSIELGFVFKDYLAVAGAVRAGVRIASATPRNATFAQTAADRVASTGGAMNLNDVQQLWVYKVDPLPAQGGTGTDKPVGFTTFSDCTTCVKFTWNAGTKHFDVLSDNWASTDQNACTPASGGPPNRIGVYMQLNHNAFTKFVFTNLNIAEASILSLEPMPVSATCK
jgi:Flp pilus assembly protein TadG